MEKKIKLFLPTVALAGQYVKDAYRHLWKSCAHLTCGGCSKQVKPWLSDSWSSTSSAWGSGSFSHLNQHMTDSLLGDEYKYNKCFLMQKVWIFTSEEIDIILPRGIWNKISVANSNIISLKKFSLQSNFHKYLIKQSVFFYAECVLIVCSLQYIGGLHLQVFVFLWWRASW